MVDLKEIIATPKTGFEILTDNGKNTDYSLLDFWRWSVSDILSNATRGRFAEFIIGTAVGLDPIDLRDEWDAFDIKTASGIKIEVKSASYIQSWNQRKYSKITFSIKKTKSWETEHNSLQRGEPRRHADLYVFCHLKHKDQSTIDPLKMEQWDFYVLPRFVLDNYEGSEYSISLNSLKRLTESNSYGVLNSSIKKAYRKQLKNERV